MSANRLRHSHGVEQQLLPPAYGNLTNEGGASHESAARTVSIASDVGNHKPARSRLVALCIVVCVIAAVYFAIVFLYPNLFKGGPPRGGADNETTHLDEEGMDVAEEEDPLFTPMTYA